MTRYSITIITDGVPEIVEFELSDTELKSFQQYLTNYEKLRETSLIKNGFITSLKIEIDESGIVINTKMPSSEAISSFLHRLRPFILQKEPASYAVITGLLKRRIINGQIKKIVKEQAALFSGAPIPKKIQIYSNKVPIFTEEALLKWINAYEYHQDEEKRKEIEVLYKNIGGLNTANAVYLMLLTEKMKAISCVADLIKILFVKGFIFEVKA